MYTEQDVKFIKDILQRHDFLVKATIVQENPEDVILSVDYPDKTKDIYRIAKSGMIAVNEEIVYINPGLSRLYVILDIFKRMRADKLPSTIIQCHNLKGEAMDRLDDIIPSPPEDKKELELKTSSRITEITNDRKLMNKFDGEMRAGGIYAGFNILKGLIV